jgi:beta-1,2-mannobiose phosphorylase / 1,2-beta-oligomannan phosphorylase
MLKKDKKLNVSRYSKNPILSPQLNHDWEARGAFNSSVLKEEDGGYHFFYRAFSKEHDYLGHYMSVSTIGYGQSKDGFNVTGRRQLIIPEYEWEKYGCEDPRVTKLENKYFIFYTALSEHPPTADGIRIGLAITKDLQNIEEKHLITHFNAKAMALLPEKIDGQYVAILTPNTDRPPSSIAVARFDRLDDLWSPGYWEKWYQELDQHEIKLNRIDNDQIEVGGVPVKTKHGWLLTYAHIQHYPFEKKRVFGIETVLLDLKDPQQIIARTKQPLLVPEPEVEYEAEGVVSNVIFPSSALIEGEKLRIYYGAADTHTAVAEVSLPKLISEMKANPFKQAFHLVKYHRNPILIPRTENFWEANSVFNPAVVFEDGKFYVVYRAQSPDNTSTMGLAESDDGFHFKRHHEPIYVPRKDFEQKKEAGRLSGCEDPRITRLGDEFFMFYTAYNGIDRPRVALSSITVKDFVNHNWQWSEPKVISSPETDNKNSCLLPEKVKGRYVILHRIAGKDIAIDYLDSLEELQQENVWLEKEQSISPREDWWDGEKIGIAGPPLRVDQGWLLLYHGVSDIDHHYRVGFMILDKDDPGNVLYRTPYPILKPTEEFEKIGDVDNVVFPCGAVIVKGTLFVYYGGADKVVCVATSDLDDLLAQVKL